MDTRSVTNFDVYIQFTENHLRRIALANNSMENVFGNLTLLREQPKRVKSLNSGQNLSHKFFGLDFCVLLFFQLLGPCLINCDV